jgi:hypothetical protein|nr:MAG TPA: hypothetical protein [Caudoviricetes sp.]
MLKETITYTDFDGNPRTEDLYFHLSPAEMTQLQYSVQGGLKNKLEEAMQKQDGKTMMEFFVQIVKMSYGVKSADGRKFEKSEEIYNDFSQTNAYVEFFMKLVTDEAFTKRFIDSVMPNMEKYTKPAANGAAAPAM